LLALTREGRAAFAPLDRQSHDEAGALLDTLSAGDQRRLVAATDAIESLLDDDGLRLRLGAEGCEWARANHTPERFLEAFTALTALLDG